MAALSIYLFGVGRIRHHATEAVAELPPSIRGLLGYLVLNRHQSHHRDVLANEFWSEVDEPCARNRLSTRLWRLRRLLEPAGTAPGSYLIASRQGYVGFNAGSDHWLDVAAFENAAICLVDTPAEAVTRSQIDAFEQATTMCCSDLLEGVDHPWLVIERERLAGLYAAANLRAMEWYVRAGEPEHAVVACQRILRRDPLREDVHRILIRIFCRSDQRSKAVRQFEDCRKILHDELGVLPLPETVAAAAEASQAPVASQTLPLEVDAAVDLIGSAAEALGLLVTELDRIVLSLKRLTPTP